MNLVSQARAPHHNARHKTVARPPSQRRCARRRRCRGKRCKPAKRNITVEGGEPIKLDVEVEVAGAIEVTLRACQRPKTLVRAVPLTAGEPAELKATANQRRGARHVLAEGGVDARLPDARPYRIEGEWDGSAIAPR